MKEGPGCSSMGKPLDFLEQDTIPAPLSESLCGSQGGALSGRQWRLPLHPLGGYLDFSFPDLIRKCFHPIKLGGEIAQPPLQGVKLFVEVSQCLRQGLDPGGESSN